MIKKLATILLVLIAKSTVNCVFSNSQYSYNDPCYDSKTGTAQRCIPQFENVAFNKQVIASSQCGDDTPMSYCIRPQTMNRKLMHASNGKQCGTCDANSRHGTSFLTDLEETNTTCWISAPVYKPTEKGNMTLSISFGKKYELTYISLQFCTMLKPDSLSIMKSMDYGKTWIPFQFYSSECNRVFSRPLKATITQANEQEAVCTDQHLKSSPFNTNRIGFSTLEGRPSFHDFDTSPVLQDWVTATDIKIVFDRLLSPNMLAKYKNLRKSRNNKRISSRSFGNRRVRSEVQTQVDQFGYFFAAVSELAIGGRCKCNGHASRCILNKNGKYQCDCKHNTAGLECERCLPFHYDRPWARATPRDANECIACDCNNHSNECRFNHELYKLSGDKKSGGICLNCQDNTMGRNCHYCKNGFYRDSLKPIQSKSACKECNCHMIGSASKSCNQNSGQCECKEGVTGIRCDRCMKGYRQSNSPIVPCEKIEQTTTTTTTTTTSTTTKNSSLKLFGQSFKSPYQSYFNYANQYSNTAKNDYNDYYYDDVEDPCEYCKTKSQRVTFREFCKNDYAIAIRLTKQEKEDGKTENLDTKIQGNNFYSKFTCDISRIYKAKPPTTTNNYYEIIRKQTLRQKVFNLKNYEKISLWVENRDLTCNCPKLKINKKYLIMTKSYSLVQFLKSQSEQANQVYSISPTKLAGILLDRETFITEWRGAFLRRMRRFNRHFKNGKCARFNYN